MPILATRTIAWPDEAACAATGQRLAAVPGVRSATIALHGQLGAGKTTFVRHLLRGLGVAGAVKSPTYAVVEPYDLAAGGHAWHFDFYRFADPQEWEDAGFREIYASDGLKVAEWPELASGLLPEADLGLSISIDGGVLDPAGPADQADPGDPADPADPAGQADPADPAAIADGATASGRRTVRLDAHTACGLALLAAA